jgi:hypothetical protein
MATFGTGDFAAMYKELYPDTRSIMEVVYDANPFMASLNKMNALDGAYLKQPILIGDAAGASSSISEALANGSAPLTRAWQLNRKKFYQVGNIDHELMMSSKTNAGAFTDAFAIQMKSVKRNLANQICYNLFGAGTGTIGQIISTQSAGSTTLTMTNATDVRKLSVNQAIQPCASESGGSPGTKVYVLKILDEEAGTFQVAATMGGSAITATASGLTASVYVFQAGDYGNVLQGLRGWLPASVASNDSFFGVNRSEDRRRLAGNYLDLRNMNLVDAILKADAVNSLGGGRADTCWVHPYAFLAIQKELMGKVMITEAMLGKEVQLPFSSIKIAGVGGTIKIMADRSCPEKEMFLLQSDTWTLGSLGELVEIFDTDGNITLRSATADTLEFRLYSYAQLYCRAPGLNCRFVVNY